MELKPFDKVLTRDENGETWEINIFGRYEKNDPVYPYRCINDRYKQCIPYKGNESLLGTTKDFTMPEVTVIPCTHVILTNNIILLYNNDKLI